MDLENNSFTSSPAIFVPRLAANLVDLLPSLCFSLPLILSHVCFIKHLFYLLVGMSISYQRMDEETQPGSESSDAGPVIVNYESITPNPSPAPPSTTSGAGSLIDLFRALVAATLFYLYL